MYGLKEDTVEENNLADQLIMITDQDGEPKQNQHKFYGQIKKIWEKIVKNDFKLKGLKIEDMDEDDK
jgi:hypothetical protein